jgi:hypothetical protein
LANAYQDSPPVTLRLASTPQYSYIAGDFSGQYRAHGSPHPDRDDNPYAKTVIRELLFLRPMHALVVFDRLQSQNEVLPGDSVHPPATSAAAVVKTFALHSEFEPHVSGTSITAASGNSVLRAWTLVPEKPVIHVVNEADIPKPDRNFRYQYRTDVDASGNTQSYFLTVIQARDASQGDVTPSVADRGGSYLLTLTLPGAGKAVIRFDKGMSSKGGAVGYAAAGEPGLVPLPSGVQPMHVTDRGRCGMH